MDPIKLTDEWQRAALARAVPSAYWDAEEKFWIMRDPTPRGATVALKLFPELTITHPELVELRETLNHDVRPFDNATELGLTVGAANVRKSLAEHTKCSGCGKAQWFAPECARCGAELDGESLGYYPFQELDLGYLSAVLRKHSGAYLGWERGLGKTLGACSLIDDLDVESALIVCPNTAKINVWKAEIEEWLPEFFDTVIVLPNAKAKRERTLELVRTLRKEGAAVCLIVHYEALPIIAGTKASSKGGLTSIKNGWDKYGEWDMIVVDESHRLANRESNFVRALKKIPRKYALCMSGSMIQNHLEELFSPLQFLFPDVYKRQWDDWNNRYLDYVEGPYGKILIGVKVHERDTMRKELGVFTVYRRKEDELDLPDRLENIVHVELSEGQQRVYNQLGEQMLAELPNGERIKVPSALSILGKLRQIATGLDVVAENVADSTKLDHAEQIITDDSDENFVVFTWYKAAGRALSDRLTKRGIENFVIDGDVPHAKRDKIIAEFQGGKGRVIIGTLSTMSESVTLTRATHAIFLDRHWNPATNDQGADRIYRIGQDKPVTITHLIAKNTVDDLRVMPVIVNKEALRRAVFGGN